MSDSEEDFTFESADEGDEETTHKSKKNTKEERDLKGMNQPPEKVKEGNKDVAQSAEKGERDPKESVQSSETDERKELAEKTDSKPSNPANVSLEDEGGAGGDTPQDRKSTPPGANCASPKAMEISEDERSVATPYRGEEAGKGDTRAAGDVRNALDKLTGADNTSLANSGGSWGSWTSWGTSLLSTATESVSTFTHQVEEGLSTVMETVEAGLSVPTPEELASEKLADEIVEHDAGSEEEAEASDKEFDAKKAEVEGAKSEGGSWLSGWGVSGLTHAVQNTVTGSLDVLETLGKKTMVVLNEGDPGLKKTKSLFTGRKENKAVLSEVLREAKVNAEKEAEAEKEFVESRQAHFGYLFDEYQGLAHLEALEMLSNQSETKVHAYLTTVKSEMLQDLKPQLILIKEAFEIDGMDDEEEDYHDNFIKLITEYLSNLRVQASPDKLMKSHSSIHETMKKCKSNQDDGEKIQGKDLHRSAIQALAEFTSKVVEQFHKAGELTLLHKEESMSVYEERAKNLASLTKTFCSELSHVSSKFTEYLHTAEDDSEDPDSVSALITNVYLEAANSSTYIQEAFQLLLPVIQLAAIESTVS